jgi:hypothetical protein
MTKYQVINAETGEVIELDEAKDGLFSDEKAAGAIAQRFSKAVAEIKGYLAERGKNTQQGFSFATAEDLKALVREPISNAELAIIPTMPHPPVITEDPREWLAKKGWENYIVPMEIIILAPEGYMRAPWYGMARDNAGFGPGKGVTAGYKSWLVQAFLVPRGEEDPDAGSKEEGEPGENNGRRKNRNPSPPKKSKWTRPMKPETLKEALGIKLGEIDEKAPTNPDGFRGLVVGNVNKILNVQKYGADAVAGYRHALFGYVWGEESSKKLTIPQLFATLRWATDRVDGSDTLSPNVLAMDEAWRVVRQVYAEAGNVDELPELQQARLHGEDDAPESSEE